MGILARAAGAGAVAAVLGACAAVSGLDAFHKGACVGACSDGGDDASPQQGLADGGEDAPREASDASDAGAARDSGRDAGTSSDAAPGDAGCDGACREGGPPHYGCAIGGCGGAGGACSDAGLPCYCFEDTQCISGKCVAVAGQNNVSCGALCTGSGATDSIDCVVAPPGIPALAPAVFSYAPANFDPAAVTPPATATTIDCDTTYDSSTHTFTGFCAGRTPPTILSGVAQSGGPPLDILAFRGLHLTAGHTLGLVSSAAGGSAVVLAVYGTADIEGTIHADGQDGASGTATAGLSGPGGSFSCGTSAGTSQTAALPSGGGGAGASAAGGNGASGIAGSVAAGGAARPNAMVQPLLGGCSGGTSGSWACRTSGGGAGGAVQISASGQVVVTGTITANGGNGGTSMCSAQACVGQTYGGGGGGAGSGGAISLEGQNVVTTGSTLSVNGGNGGDPNVGAGAMNPGQGGAGGTSGSPAGAPGTGASTNPCGPPSQCGGGGGGSYGYTSVNSVGPAACTTTLSPPPVANALLTACLCVADLDCSSGKCVNAGQCTGTCTGTGTADVSGCQALLSK